MLRSCKLVDEAVLKELNSRAALANSPQLEQLLQMRQQLDQVLSVNYLPPEEKLARVQAVLFHLSPAQTTYQANLNQMGPGYTASQLPVNTTNPLLQSSARPRSPAPVLTVKSNKETPVKLTEETPLKLKPASSRGQDQSRVPMGNSSPELTIGPESKVITGTKFSDSKKRPF